MSHLMYATLTDAAYEALQSGRAMSKNGLRSIKGAFWSEQPILSEITDKKISKIGLKNIAPIAGVGIAAVATGIIASKVIKEKREREEQEKREQEEKARREEEKAEARRQFIAKLFMKKNESQEQSYMQRQPMQQPYMQGQPMMYQQPMQQPYMQGQPMMYQQPMQQPYMQGQPMMYQQPMQQPYMQGQPMMYQQPMQQPYMQGQPMMYQQPMQQPYMQGQSMIYQQPMQQSYMQGQPMVQTNDLNAVQNDYSKVLPIKEIDGWNPEQLVMQVNNAYMEYKSNNIDIRTQYNLLMQMYAVANIAAFLKVYSEICAQRRQIVDDTYWVWKEKVQAVTVDYITYSVLEILKQNPNIVSVNIKNEINAFLIITVNEQKIRKQAGY